MARWRERVRLEDGFKLDLNVLVRQGLVRPGAHCSGSIHWRYRFGGEEVARGWISADMTGEWVGSFRLEFGGAVQVIALAAQPRRFGGRQWYFVCPSTARLISVLWRPPGARSFGSRQAWGRQVAYASQFETCHGRALTRAQDIRFQLGGADCVSLLDGIDPPRPKGMHWATYERKIKKCHRYELICNQYLAGALARFKP